jgi:uncharacterized protein
VTETGPTGGHTLHQFPEKVAVLRMPPGTDVPAWAESSSVFAIVATATETAVVCAGRSVPTKVPGDRGLLAFTLADGDRPESPAGVLVELLAPLAEDGVTVHVLTTAATVWVLVPAPEAERAAEAWRRRGHTVAPAPTA